MRRRLMLLIAPAALACATVAAAQPAPPPGDVRVIRRGGPPPEEMKAHVEAMKKQHMEDLKTVLRLRPDQEAALAAFMASHEPQKIQMKLPDPKDGPKTLTTPQRLDEMARREDAMRAAGARRREALTRFYAALSPDQQKVFDALQRLQGPRGHGGPGMGRGGPGMMMLHGGPGGDRRIEIRREVRGGPGGPKDD
ncbi:Spy/CpxP family protein refolding chaperone [Phenylobacterium sp.]|uniref:Spy/CpxP family protein refolding chaperone n=1 Tax=Phenylobacterium sp. TaxID=1871053 RepID=UPI0025E3B1B3|nr:Spy/CpxP family protein refolding chaperone [Phenylobacterium sp.]MBX3483380.1 Spy/CpxP family protein refolding chaperone [Phenylobacterium sp.]